MEKFTVSINLTADVSKVAADELESLVEEFVQNVANVFANDRIDTLAELINSLIPGAVVDAGLPEYVHEVYPASMLLDEGSDAPNHADDNSNLAQDNSDLNMTEHWSYPGKRYTAAENDFGATDFDRR